jgi:hypothetical protein
MDLIRERMLMSNREEMKEWVTLYDNTFTEDTDKSSYRRCLL